MRNLKITVMSALMLLGIMAVPVFAVSSTVHASAQSEICTGAGGVYTPGVRGGNGTCASKTGEKSLELRFQDIVNVLLFITGAIAVIMIVIGGLRYTLSNGDAKAVESAKNVVLYAVVGLVVAILAFAIVRFVVGVF